MLPAAFPGLPAMAFPGLLLPSGLLPVGVSTVDVTAAIAVIVWAFAGLIALRLAIRMGRDTGDSPQVVRVVQPTKPRDGFRDAA